MKNFNFKSMFVGVITGSLLFGGIVGASTLITDNVYLSTHSITVDGKNYKSENPLLNYAGTTYVPLREFGTITGSSVSFANGTITIKKPTTTSNSTSNNTSSNTSSNTSTSTSALNGKKITIDADESDSFYVDLSAYNSKTASIAVTSGTAYASVSKSSVTASGLITVKGKKEGSSVITVTYNNGYKDYVYITVNGSEEIEIEVGKSDYIEIDLDEYDADKATLSISSGSSYVKLEKTEVTKSSKVKVTGKKSGEATIKVKYDTGETAFYDIIVKKGSSSMSGDEIEVEIDRFSGKFVYYIDLEEWDADSADVFETDSKSCIKVSSTSFTKDGALTITGSKEGEAEVEIEFYDDDNDEVGSFIIYVTVVDEDDFDFDDYDFEDEIYLDLDEDEKITVDPDDYDAEWATISIITGKDYVSASKTYVTSNKDITIYGDDKNEGEAIIQITYSTGDIEYYYIEVED